MKCPKCNEDILSMSVHYCSAKPKNEGSGASPCSDFCEPCGNRGWITKTDIMGTYEALCPRCMGRCKKDSQNV